MRSRTAVTAVVGVVATIVAAGLVTAGPMNWLKLAGALVFACSSAGAGVMCWIDAGEASAQAGMVLVVSLALVALLAAVMIWLASWHPMAAFLVLAAASALSCVARLATARAV